MNEIKALREEACTACSGSGYYTTGKCGACNGSGKEFSEDEILTEINNRYEAMKLKENTMSQWISIEDRMPEEDIKVIIFSYGQVCWGFYSRDENEFYESWNPYARIYENETNATHWQPLPEPPT